MKSLRILGPGAARWLNVPIPAPSDHEVLIRVDAATSDFGLDISSFFGNVGKPRRSVDQWGKQNPGSEYPFLIGQPGQQLTGIVVDMGTEVKSLSIGMRVVNWQRLPLAGQGGYCQYGVYPAASFIQIPQNVLVEEVVILALATKIFVQLHSLDQRASLLNKSVCLLGAGPLELLVAQMLEVFGINKVFAPEPRERNKMRRNSLDKLSLLPPAEITRLIKSGVPDYVMQVGDANCFVDEMQSYLKSPAEVLSPYLLPREAIGHSEAAGNAIADSESAHKVLELILKKKISLGELVPVKVYLGKYDLGLNYLKQRKAPLVLFLPW